MLDLDTGLYQGGDCTDKNAVIFIFKSVQPLLYVSSLLHKFAVFFLENRENLQKFISLCMMQGFFPNEILLGKFLVL